MQRTLVGMTLAGWLALIPAVAMSQQNAPAGYPERPVRVIVPVPPGGGHDIVGRIVTGALSDAFGKPFVVDNRAGAGSVIGTDIAAKAQPDGYTLMVAAANFTIAPFLYPNVPYDAGKDFAAITQLTAQPLLLTVTASLKAGTVQELIALAKARPGELNLALADPGGSSSLAAELFKMVTRTNMVSVQYKGQVQGLVALMSNEVQVLVTTPAAVMQHLKGGKLRVLAITGNERASYLPGVPTLAEAGVKETITGSWQGLVAPAKTPPAIIDRLYRQTLEVLRLPAVRERFTAVGASVVGSSPKEFSQFIARELAQNARVIKAAGLKAD